MTADTPDTPGTANTADIALRRQERDFIAAERRLPACAGSSYPDDPAALRAFFDALFESTSAPRSDGRHRTAGGRLCPAGGRLCGILTPHIDLQIGARSYVAPFRQLRASEFDVCVILGTAHYPAGIEPFILTEKDFVTPLGVAATDRRFVRRLREAVGDGTHAGTAHAGTAGDEMADEAATAAVIAPDDLPFRIEHSVEFPVLFLQYLFGDALPPIVPVLCNSFDHFLIDGRDPARDASCAAFLGAFRDTLRETDLRPMYIVSVDWSHVGRKFGHDVDADAVLEYVRCSDSEQLAALERCDIRAFRDLLSATENVTLIDGFSCISVFFELAAPRQGRLLSWDLWHEEEQRSAVSFAGMAFYGDGDDIAAADVAAAKDA